MSPLRDQIAEQERELKAQERAETDARDEADEAQAAIDEANDIHAHPEATLALAAALERDQAEHAEQANEVEQLAETERSVRERTRGSRLRLIGAIAAIAVTIALVAAVWLSLGK